MVAGKTILVKNECKISAVDSADIGPHGMTSFKKAIGETLRERQCSGHWSRTSGEAVALGTWTEWRSPRRRSMRWRDGNPPPCAAIE